MPRIRTSDSTVGTTTSTEAPRYTITSTSSSTLLYMQGIPAYNTSSDAGYIRAGDIIASAYSFKRWRISISYQELDTYGLYNIKQILERNGYKILLIHGGNEDILQFILTDQVYTDDTTPEDTDLSYFWRTNQNKLE